MYTELEEKCAALVAITEALKKALEDSPGRPTLTYFTLDTETDETTEVTGKIPIYTARDEATYVEYKTPSVVMFQPYIVPMRDMITNLKSYKDYDYEKMEVKEFYEPLPAKVRFLIHLATINPDNDAKLTKWLTEQMFALTAINVKDSPELDEYKRLTVYWHDPEVMDSDDTSRITEFMVDVRTRLEILDFTRRKLLRPAVDINVSTGDYTSTKYFLNAYTAFNTYPDATSIQMVDSLKNFPRSGTCEFDESGEQFSYTSRTKYKFMGVTGIDNFHRFGERVNFVE
jgi:hypothetical protein